MAVPYYPGITITPNLGLSLVGMDEVIAEDFVLVDAAVAGVIGVLPVFQTNGINNPVQTTLDVIGGTGIVVVSDAFGGLTITSSAIIGVFSITLAKIAHQWLDSYSDITGI